MFEKKQRNESITISVIIPVYNVEPWIDRCIRSLKSQKQEGLEFIFIDDCSTDGSINRIKAFAKEDLRVRLIKNKTNIGPGPSRNLGIELANGEYLSFIDPDDWISDDFYTILYDKACKTGSDIIKGNREEIDHNKVIKVINRTSPLNSHIKRYRRKNIPLFILFTYEHQTAIYKSSLIKEKGIRYGFSRKGEDTTFLLNLCLNTESIQFCDEAIYYYFYKRPNSIANDISVSRIINERDALAERLDILLKDDLNIFALHRISRDIKKCINTLSCLHKEGCTDDSLTEIQLQIKRQIMRVKKPNDIYKITPEIKVFVDYDYLIPTGSIHHLDGLLSDRVKDWGDFMEKYPNLKDPLIIDGCTHVFMDFAFSIIKPIIHSMIRKRTYNPENFYLIKEQWNRLDKRMRHRIIIHSPKVFYNIISKPRI